MLWCIRLKGNNLRWPSNPKRYVGEGQVFFTSQLAVLGQLFHTLAIEGT